jgi:hypothetical protein
MNNRILVRAGYKKKPPFGGLTVGTTSYEAILR